MGLYGSPSPYRKGKGPDQIGVYELWWSDNIIYIGSGNIQNRLLTHNRDPEKNFQRYKCNITNDTRRAIQMERREQRAFRKEHGHLPKYNDQIGGGNPY